MKIFVCIKQVPDVNAPIKIKDGELIQESERMVLNAYDASAVEEALVLAEQDETAEVHVVMVSGGKAKETIRKALAMGAHSATQISVDDTKSHDSSSYASILADFFMNQEYDAIFTGKQSQDTDAGLAGTMLAEQLNLPYASNAVGLEKEGESLAVTRQGDVGQEIIQLPFPCLVTCSNDMNEPRIPSLKGIMKSKKKPMEQTSTAELDTQATAATQIDAYEEIPERQAGPKVEGDPQELAQKLSSFLNGKGLI